MNRRQVLRAALLFPATLATACGGSRSGPMPIATIAVPSAEQAQSTEPQATTKTQAKPTFIEFYADW